MSKELMRLLELSGTTKSVTYQNLLECRQYQRGLMLYEALKLMHHKDTKQVVVVSDQEGKAGSDEIFKKICKTIKSRWVSIFAK